jgi:hypothetical protein
MSSPRPYLPAAFFILKKKLRLLNGAPFLRIVRVPKHRCLSNCFAHAVLHTRAAIYRNGVCVGYVRRTAFGHTVGRSVATGYLRHPEGGNVTLQWLKEPDALVCIA